MFSAIARTGITLTLVALLQSCGGGGGGGGGGAGGGNLPGGGGNDPVTRLTVSNTTVSVSAAPGQAAPTRNVTLSVSNPPPSGLYVEAGYTAQGIATLDFGSNSATQGTLIVNFRLPGSLPSGSYTDTIQVRVCTDEACLTQISGSPVTITTTFTVSATGTSTVAIDRSSVALDVTSDDAFARAEVVRLTLSAAPATEFHVQTSHTTNAVQSALYRMVSATVAEVDVRFLSGQQLGPGTYSDTVEITVCYDPSCVQQVQGGPFTVAASLTVGTAPEPGVTPLEVASRVALPHDVIDAEYSKALDRIVMVGSYPANALYVYDVATGTERQRALNRAPTAVSISPDGLTAAVGHDALVTVIDLASVGQPGAPDPVILNLTTVAYDLILDGSGYVHVLPRLSQGDGIHSLHIASNTEQVSTGRSIGSESRGRLHPSGNHLYTAIRASTPDDIEKWDIASGTAAWLYDSRYHGEHSMCGDLWYKEGGATIYTACGNTFRSSSVQAEDMLYDGRLQLTPTGPYGWRVRSLSQSAALEEIALIEYELYHCELVPGAGPCYMHLAYYESAFLNRLAVYALGPVEVNGATYAQRGLFVFHDAAGTTRYLLSRIQDAPDRDVEYHLSVIR